MRGNKSRNNTFNQTTIDSNNNNYLEPNNNNTIGTGSLLYRNDDYYNNNNKLYRLKNYFKNYFKNLKIKKKLKKNKVCLVCTILFLISIITTILLLIFGGFSLFNYTIMTITSRNSKIHPLLTEEINCEILNKTVDCNDLFYNELINRFNDNYLNVNNDDKNKWFWELESLQDTLRNTLQNTLQNNLYNLQNEYILFNETNTLQLNQIKFTICKIQVKYLIESQIFKEINLDPYLKEFTILNNKENNKILFTKNYFKNITTNNYLNFPNKLIFNKNQNETTNCFKHFKFNELIGFYNRNFIDYYPNKIFYLNLSFILSLILLILLGGCIAFFLIPILIYFIKLFFKKNNYNNSNNNSNNNELDKELDNLSNNESENSDMDSNESSGGSGSGSGGNSENSVGGGSEDNSSLDDDGEDSDVSENGRRYF
ncbi:hypothetical protein ABK040_011466 [Willaertia magna]